MHAPVAQPSPRENTSACASGRKEVHMQANRSWVDQVKVASGPSFLVGLRKTFAPVILGHTSPGATTDAVIVGLLVAILAAIRFLGTCTEAWLSWMNVALGVWLIVAPFVLRDSEVEMTNAIIVGILVVK
jgi:hypothetical protein